VKDIEGDVCLIDSVGKEVSGVRGRFITGFYKIGGGDPRNDRYKRVDVPESFLASSVCNVCGEVWIDTARMELEAKNLSGVVRIRNCFGTTRFYKAEQCDGDQTVIETESGGIEVKLGKELAKTVDVTAISLAGTLDYRMMKDVRKMVRAWNNAEIMYVSTVVSPKDESLAASGLGAAIVLRSKMGKICVGMMEGE